jgi:hypothetical protein
MNAQDWINQRFEEAVSGARAKLDKLHEEMNRVAELSSSASVVDYLHTVAAISNNISHNLGRMTIPTFLKWMHLNRSLVHPFDPHLIADIHNLSKSTQKHLKEKATQKNEGGITAHSQGGNSRL